MNEQIEDAVVISEEKNNTNKYFLAIHKEAELKIAENFDFLKKERVEAKNKYANIDKSESNIDEIRKAKNTLVKFRTAINGANGIEKEDNKKINVIVSEIKTEFKFMVDTLVGITEPTEKELNEIVTKVDNAKAIAEQKERERIEGLKKSLADYKHDFIIKVNDMKKSTDVIEIDFDNVDYSEIEDLKVEVESSIKSAYADRSKYLKDREDLEAEKEKLRKEKEELEKLKPVAQGTQNLGRMTFGIDPAKEGGDVSNNIVINNEDIIEMDDDVIAPAEIESMVNELEKTLKEAEFKPTFKQIYEHLYKTYPFLHHDKYFIAMKEMI